MLIFLLILIFITTRLINLMAFPPFLDETIYIRWLETIKISKNLLLPLQEFGWEPLSIWFSSLINIFVNNSLLSLRLTAVFFGFLTTITLYFFLKNIVSRKHIFFILLTYILSPIILLHHRLGLRGEPVVSFTLALTLYGLYFRLIKKQANKSYLISLAIILGLLTKTTAVAIPFIAVISFLVFKPKLKYQDFRALALTTIPVVFYTLTHTLTLVLNKSSVFVNTAGFPLQTKNNLLQIWLWFYQYLSWPVVLLFIFGLVFSFRQNKNLFKLLIISFLTPLVFVIVSAKILFPRYLLLSFLAGLLLAGFGFSQLFYDLPKLLRPLSIIIFFPSLFLSFYLIQDIKTAKLPEIERWQYVSGWPSGFGLRELTGYLRSDSPDILVTEHHDLVKTGLPYLWPEHSFKILPMTEDLKLPEINPQGQNTYLVLNILDQLPDQFSGELIQEFPRPDNKSSLRLYKIENIK